MVVGLLTVELHVPGSQSLKDKRMVLRRVKDRLKKFNVAVSEVEHQDLWQRAALAVVTVSADHAHRGRVSHVTQGSRPHRIGDQLRSELADLLAREVHDPGVGFVTLTRV